MYFSERESWNLKIISQKIISIKLAMDLLDNSFQRIHTSFLTLLNNFKNMKYFELRSFLYLNLIKHLILLTISEKLPPGNLTDVNYFVKIFA